jgi:hypothetical protein
MNNNNYSLPIDCIELNELKEICCKYSLDLDEMCDVINRRTTNFKYAPSKKYSHKYLLFVKYLSFEDDYSVVEVKQNLMTKEEYIFMFRYCDYLKVIDVHCLDKRFGYMCRHDLMSSMARRFSKPDHNYHSIASSVQNVVVEMKDSHMKRKQFHKDARRHSTNNKMKLVAENSLCNDLNNEIFKFLGWN